MKLIFITGGSRGLGAALTHHYSSQGDCHTLELSRSGSSAVHINCDLANAQAVAATASGLFSELARQHWDEIILISNAGSLSPIRGGSTLTVDEISHNITVNQLSSFSLITEFMRAFRNASGPKTIVNVSSGAAHKSYAGWSLYCASKAASESFINTLALEEQQALQPFTLINYDPGVMDTEMQAELRDASEEHFHDKARFVAFKADGVLQSAEYVASDLIDKLSNGVSSGQRYQVD